MTTNTDFTNDQFELRVIKTDTHRGATYIHVHTTDRFSRKTHRLQRRGVRIFVDMLERYLRKRPRLTHTHKTNIARHLIYTPPAIKAWSAYMPGGFATYPVHNPDRTHLKDGQKIDFITKTLFRHAVDSIGLRSRAYAMSWFIHEQLGKKDLTRWLSIASGTGQPTFDAARLLEGRVQFYLVDLDRDALEFARRLADEYGISDDAITTARVDVTDRRAATKFFEETHPDVIEVMGLFEYLPDDKAIALLATLRPILTHARVLVFTNMRPEHPHLHVHQRGLGWPGVIQRTTHEVLALLDSAGYQPGQVSVLLPDDDVYAVYALVPSQK